MELNPERRINLRNILFPIRRHAVRVTGKAFRFQRMIPESDSTQKASSVHSRDKSTGALTSRVSNTFGECGPNFGDGGNGGVIGSRMRSSGSRINGINNCGKSVAWSIRDRLSRIESNNPVAPGGRQSGSGGIADGHSRDKSTGAPTSRVSDTFGELGPDFGDGGIGGVIGSRII